MGANAAVTMGARSTLSRLFASPQPPPPQRGGGSWDGDANDQCVHPPLVLCRYVHCVCHRESLAVVAATKSTPYLQNKFYPVIDCVAFHHEVSGKRQASAEESQILHYGESEKFKRCAATRWMTVDAGTGMLDRKYIAVVDDLDRRGDGDATDRDVAGAKWFGIGVGEADVTAKGASTTTHPPVLFSEWAAPPNFPAWPRLGAAVTVTCVTVDRRAHFMCNLNTNVHAKAPTLTQCCVPATVSWS